MPFLIRSVLLRRSGPLGVALTAYDVWRRLPPRRRQQLVAHGRRGGIAGVVLSVFGLLARMVVFGLVGIFLIKAAVDYSAKQAVGLDGALPKLAAQSDGPALPGVVAAGLVSFAVFSICDALPKDLTDVAYEARAAAMR
jgi:hypothetical protein